MTSSFHAKFYRKLTKIRPADFYSNEEAGRLFQANVNFFWLLRSSIKVEHFNYRHYAIKD